LHQKQKNIPFICEFALFFAGIDFWFMEIEEISNITDGFLQVVL